MKTRKTFTRILSIFLAVLMFGGMMGTASAAEEEETDFRFLYKKEAIYIDCPDIEYVTILGYEGTAPEHLVIPDEIEGCPVTDIESKAFQNCDTIKTLSIPGSLRYMGSACFSGCKNLETVEGEGMFIGPYAFRDCTALRSVSRIYSICNGAFMNCTALEEVTVCEYDLSVEENAFLNCSSLKTVYFYGYETETLDDCVEETGNTDCLNANWVLIYFCKEFGETKAYISGDEGEIIDFYVQEHLKKQGVTVAYDSIEVVRSYRGGFASWTWDYDSDEINFLLVEEGWDVWYVYLLDEGGNVVHEIDLYVEVEPSIKTLVSRLWNRFSEVTLTGRLLNMIIRFVQNLIDRIKQPA